MLIVSIGDEKEKGKGKGKKENMTSRNYAQNIENIKSNRNRKKTELVEMQLDAS